MKIGVIKEIRLEVEMTEHGRRFTANKTFTPNELGTTLFLPGKMQCRFINPKLKVISYTCPFRGATMSGEEALKQIAENELGHAAVIQDVIFDNDARALVLKLDSKRIEREAIVPIGGSGWSERAR